MNAKTRALAAVAATVAASLLASAPASAHDGTWRYCGTAPNGLDVVYWIAPENGAKKAATPHVFHICQSVSPLRGKTVNSGSVTQAYSENATRITKQIPMEQKQCGFAADKAAAPAAG